MLIIDFLPPTCLTQLPPELHSSSAGGRRTDGPGGSTSHVCSSEVRGQQPSPLLPKPLERMRGRGSGIWVLHFSGVLNKHGNVYLKKLLSLNKQLGKCVRQLDFHNQHLWLNFRVREDLEMTSVMINRALVTWWPSKVDRWSFLLRLFKQTLLFKFFILSCLVIKSASINVSFKILQWILISGLVPIIRLKRDLWVCSKTPLWDSRQYTDTSGFLIALFTYQRWGGCPSWWNFGRVSLLTILI